MPKRCRRHAKTRFVEKDGAPLEGGRTEDRYEDVRPPPNHPFTMERENRIERMRLRAEQGLPIFERVVPDLA